MSAPGMAEILIDQHEQRGRFDRIVDRPARIERPLDPTNIPALMPMSFRTGRKPHTRCPVDEIMRLHSHWHPARGDR